MIIEGSKTILERKCVANEQYSRQECLEISGILGSISNSNLEETVLKFSMRLELP